MATHTRIKRPTRLAPAMLDQYLAEGWYRIGQTLMTCRFLMFEDVLRSTIWTRLDLQTHTFRRGQRKHLSRLAREFRVENGPAILDPQHESLYQRYRVLARGERSPTLRHFLFEDSNRDLFETREISIWRGDQLIAFSWFDIGATAIQSLIGAYEPTESSWGLGYASLLLEVKWGQENHFLHHYSGYVLPNEPAMDYKLRAGEMEWLTETGEWHPWSTFTPQTSPLALMTAALERVARALSARGIPVSVRTYPMFEAPSYDPGLVQCISEPLMAECFPSTSAASSLFVVYNLDDRSYDTLRVTRAAGMVRPPDPALPPKQVELFLHKDILATNQTAAQVAEDLAERVGV